MNFSIFVYIYFIIVKYRSNIRKCRQQQWILPLCRQIEINNGPCSKIFFIRLLNVPSRIEHIIQTHLDMCGK